MTLTRRAQKLSLCADVGTDVENFPGELPLTPSSCKTKAQVRGRLSNPLYWRISLHQAYRNAVDVNRVAGSRGIPTLFYISVTFFMVVAILATALHFAPPGKNYFDLNHWRLSNSLTSQQLHDLRHRFPIHIDTSNSDEMESIVHPGYLLADTERMNTLFNGHFEIENMTVPKFWDPDAFREYKYGVRGFLGDRGKYLITPTEASAIGSFYDDKPTIFISIASYRDPECPLTVESIFARAKHPERLRVAIVDQQRKGESDNRCRPPSETFCRASPINILCGYIGQIDYIEYPSTLMVGPVFARHLANRMYRGEYFAMQVDSHVRFVADWDEDIIDQWNSTGNEMAVISTYMNDIGKNNIDPETHASRVSYRSIMCDFEYEWKLGVMTHIKFNKQPSGTPKVTDSPMLHPFWAAGFSFSRGHLVVSVPYDHYLPLVFQGEEILQTIRGFSFGYDFYAPSRNVAFHIYAMRDNVEKRLSVPRYTENEVLFGHEVKKQAYLRLIGISGTTDPPLDFLHLEEDRYGLGRIRTREQFFDTFGIHPSTRTTEKNLCEFVQGSPLPGAPRSMHVNFNRFLRYDKMGIDYSRITYRHRTPVKKFTEISQNELASLQARLQEMIREKNNTTQGGKSIYNI